MSWSRRSVTPVRPCSHEPTDQLDRGGGQRHPGEGRRHATLLDQHQRHERLGAEERAGEDTAHQDRRRQPSPDPEDPRAAAAGAGSAPAARLRRRTSGTDQTSSRCPAYCRAPTPTAAASAGTHQPGPVLTVLGRHRAERSQPRQHEQHGRGDQRRHGEEHRAPGQVVGHQAGDRRPDDRREHPGAGDRGEQPRPHRLRVRPAHDDVQRRRPPGPRRTPAPPGPGRRPASTVAVPASTSPTPKAVTAMRNGSSGPRRSRQVAGQDHADQAGDEEGREAPGVVRQPVEVPHGHRHRGRHGHRLEGDEGHHGEQPGGQRAPLRPEHPVRRRASARCGSPRHIGKLTRASTTPGLMSISEVSLPSRVADDGEAVGFDELGLAARNHGMPLELMRHDVTPLGAHYLLTHYDIPAADTSTWRLEVGRAGRTGRCRCRWPTCALARRTHQHGDDGVRGQRPGPAAPRGRSVSRGCTRRSAR